MSVYLGNMSVEEIEYRIGVKFSDELRTELKETHQANATKVMPGKWHCYDMPFLIVCGDEGLATKIQAELSLPGVKLKTTFRISLQK